MKITQFHAKNQILIEDGNKTIFQSYNSIIAIKENGKITLGKDWDYSKTTEKYRNKFLGETKSETQRKLNVGVYTLDENI